MIIDAHAHIFPDKIAARAADGISQFYGMRVLFDGTVGSLLEINHRAGIDMALVQSVATVPEQVHNINSFIAEQVKLHPREFVGFGALHPDFPGIEAETERIISLGLKGIKLHPDFQQFNIDDEHAFPIYEAAEGRLLILFHVGDNRYDFSSPKRLYNVMKRFPKRDNRRSPCRLDEMGRSRGAFLRRADIRRPLQQPLRNDAGARRRAYPQPRHRPGDVRHGLPHVERR